ncbi:BTAD domain-containing putative transcriptional regulator, partial [Nocardia brasiliensis]|uniref:BTAD domain-containing putative transcriptional regulator n=1 Tax=Nocardia brasiliensis TaxID=37326 RepID=UPI002457A704
MYRAPPRGGGPPPAFSPAYPQTPPHGRPGGPPPAAARCFAAALELWRGLPWLELDDAPILSAERARLTELRDGAVEELQAA